MNHGSFGSCPRPVFEVYQAWQRELEAQPVEFLGRRIKGLLREARSSLGGYLNTEPENLVFVTNITTGINIVARSLNLKPGDEILATNQEYGAIDRTWRFLCQKNKAVYLRQAVSLPLTTPEAFIEEFWAGVTSRTKVISISHITSVSAITFPIEEICRRARQARILTVIDGAHAPGQIPLDLTRVGADFYVGNCRKWLCAPKGTAFLYANPSKQTLVEPLVVSWGWESFEPSSSRFLDWFEWQGTRDISAYLSVPAAIEFQSRNNWEQIRENCFEMVTAARRRIEKLIGLSPIYPEKGEYAWYRQMSIMRLPEAGTRALLQLKVDLWDKFLVEVPLMPSHDPSFLRISVQGYNTQQDLDKLYFALLELLPGLEK